MGLSEADSELFEIRITAICGHRWTSLQGRGSDREKEAKAVLIMNEWSQSLGDLTYKQIKNGLDKVRDMPNWWPVLGDFKRIACDLPTLDQCVGRVTSRNPADPVSARILNSIGLFAIQSMTESQIFKAVSVRYENVYSKIMKEAQGNDDYWKVKESPALEDQSKYQEPVASDEVMEANIGKLKDILGGSKT